MNVYIANFGTKNWAWPDCLSRSTIAVMDDVRVHPFWQKGDYEGYVAEAMRSLQSKAGTLPLRGVATRWYNVPTIMTNTSGDLWIHREKEQVWWTHSLNQPATWEVIPDPEPRGAQNEIFIYHKLCAPWSNKTKRGTSLLWSALHPKAREFLFTEGTCQQLAADNALYAHALINGDYLSGWHTKADWRAKEEKAKRGAAKIFNPVELSATAMVDSAWSTVAKSGQVSISLSIAKEKKCGFLTKAEFEEYVLTLLESQEGLCALTGLRMLHYGFDGDSELRCSLDRIDSNGHYEPGNLQVVCWFANRWKSNQENSEFLRLLSLVRGEDAGELIPQSS